MLGQQPINDTFSKSEKVSVAGELWKLEKITTLRFSIE